LNLYCRENKSPIASDQLGWVIGFRLECSDTALLNWAQWIFFGVPE